MLADGLTLVGHLVDPKRVAAWLVDLRAGMLALGGHRGKPKLCLQAQQAHSLEGTV